MGFQQPEGRDARTSRFFMRRSRSFTSFETQIFLNGESELTRLGCEHAIFNHPGKIAGGLPTHCHNVSLQFLITHYMS